MPIPTSTMNTSKDSLQPAVTRLAALPATSAQWASSPARPGGRPPPPPRVLPLLCDGLRASTPQQQRMHLITFQEHWAEVQRVSVTVEDAREYLLLLLVLANDPGRKEGRDEFATRRLQSAARLAFDHLHQAFAEPHTHFRVFVLGLKQLMRELHCDDEHFYARPAPQGPPDNYAAMRRELLKERERERAKLQALAAASETPAGDGAADGKDAAGKNGPAAVPQSTEDLSSSDNIPESATPTFALTMPAIEEAPPTITLPPSAPEALIPPAFVQSLLRMDTWLQDLDTRAFAIQLMRAWDYSGINVHYFVEGMNRVHLYLPYLYSSRTKVYRDFVCCTQRPEMRRAWTKAARVHVKTNIPARSDIMYRFLVEGYNYGVNAIINSDIAGYTHRNWKRLGKGAMEEEGWPEGWDDDMSNNYTNGATIDQYYSDDGFVVIELQSKSFFCCGFSVSAWLVVHGFGAGFELTASIHHSDERLCTQPQPIAKPEKSAPEKPPPAAPPADDGHQAQ